MKPAWLRATALGLVLAIMLGGLALTGLSGCEDVANDEMYKSGTEWAPGRGKNPARKYAPSYISMVLFGAFVMWTVCKSSRRSVVKAGEEH